MFPAIFIS